MKRFLYCALALLMLAIAWSGGLHVLPLGPFSLHMAAHMVIVAIAAPLIALGVAGSRVDPVVKHASLFPPVPASVLELVVVWAFHTPLLHHWARHSALGLLLEQSSFCLSGCYVWLAALAGEPTERDERSAAGIVALLLTSMHMTLLGALIALSPRPLFAHRQADALADQHVGGAIMLLVGGVAYLTGGLALSVRFVRPWVSRRERRI